MEEMSGRRRFFRRATMAAVVGALAAGFGGKAWAHGGGRRGGGGLFGGPLDPAALDERIERMVKHFAVEVDATPEQKARLGEIAKAAARDLHPLRRRAFEARRRGIALLAAPSIDRGAIEQLRVEQIQAADAASRRLAQALADTAEVLTPEQRRQLAERFQRRHARRHG